jgi:hypothetical protein
MDWLKKLQAKYRAGKLTKERYEAEVKQLLEDGDVNQDEHDRALEFDPKAPEGGELIYSQEDVDKMAVNVARRLIRKEFKTAGIELDVDNKGLMAHLVGLIKDGGKGELKPGQIDEKDLAALRKKAENADSLAAQLRSLTLHVTVLENAKDAPYPKQIVRAMSDYEDEIDFDDNGAPDKRSVEVVLRKLKKAEPNLFTPAGTGEGQEGNDLDNKGGGSFSGKSPGGAGGGNASATKSKEDALVEEALRGMGVEPKK